MNHEGQMARWLESRRSLTVDLEGCIIMLLLSPDEHILTESSLSRLAKPLSLQKYQLHHSLKYLDN